QRRQPRDLRAGHPLEREVLRDGGLVALQPALRRRRDAALARRDRRARRIDRRQRDLGVAGAERRVRLRRQDTARGARRAGGAGAGGGSACRAAASGAAAGRRTGRRTGRRGGGRRRLGGRLGRLLGRRLGGRLRGGLGGRRRRLRRRRRRLRRRRRRGRQDERHGGGDHDVVEAGRGDRDRDLHLLRLLRGLQLPAEDGVLSAGEVSRRAFLGGEGGGARPGQGHPARVRPDALDPHVGHGAAGGLDGRRDVDGVAGLGTRGLGENVDVQADRRGGRGFRRGRRRGGRREGGRAAGGQDGGRPETDKDRFHR